MDQYRVQIPDIYEGELKEPTAEHYYSYWQVHQLHYTQKFPDLYKNRWTFHYVLEKTTLELRPNAPNPEHLADFKGMNRYFDALSYWITVYSRARARTFATVGETDGVRRLSDSEAEDYRIKLKAYASESLVRSNLIDSDLLRFLRTLIDMYEGYRRDERYKLADELKADIWHLSNLIELKTDANQDQIEADLGYFDGRTFKHLNEAAKERDYALDLMKSMADGRSRDGQDVTPIGRSLNPRSLSLLTTVNRRDLGSSARPLAGW